MDSRHAGSVKSYRPHLPGTNARPKVRSTNDSVATGARGAPTNGRNSDRATSFRLNPPASNQHPRSLQHTRGGPNPRNHCLGHGLAACRLQSRCPPNDRSDNRLRRCPISTPPVTDVPRLVRAIARLALATWVAAHVWPVKRSSTMPHCRTRCAWNGNINRSDRPTPNPIFQLPHAIGKKDASHTSNTVASSSRMDLIGARNAKHSGSSSLLRFLRTVQRQEATPNRATRSQSMFRNGCANKPPDPHGSTKN